MGRPPLTNRHPHTQSNTAPTEHVAANELALCARAYKRITAAALASKLGLSSPAAALEGKGVVGWEVCVGRAVAFGRKAVG
jgi:hypothetical protein